MGACICTTPGTREMVATRNRGHPECWSKIFQTAGVTVATILDLIPTLTSWCFGWSACHGGQTAHISISVSDPASSPAGRRRRSERGTQPTESSAQQFPPPETLWVHPLPPFTPSGARLL